MAIGFALGLVPVVHPAFVSCRAAEALFDFSIPPQPLASALVRYGDVTGKEALYEGGLLDGLISSGAEGRLTSTAALRRILVGVGLSARWVAEDTFVLESNPDRQSAPEDLRYAALVQAHVLEALCRSSEARPGQYRLVIVFWIAADGTVEDLLRIGSAGRGEADQLIDRTLRGLRFRQSPPADFVQPVRLLIVPQSANARPVCAAFDNDLRAQGSAR